MTDRELIRESVQAAYTLAMRDRTRAQQALENAKANRLNAYHRHLVKRNMAEAHGKVEILGDILMDIDLLDLRRN